MPSGFMDAHSEITLETAISLAFTWNEWLWVHLACLISYQSHAIDPGSETQMYSKINPHRIKNSSLAQSCHHNLLPLFCDDYDDIGVATGFIFILIMVLGQYVLELESGSSFHEKTMQLTARHEAFAGTAREQEQLERSLPNLFPVETGSKQPPNVQLLGEFLTSWPRKT
ncbi:hypothetical protein VNO77_18748 [Canavalia gladiata]|uniref:Uncharacterized protein n=1 Tax=Canavalia gladiata TaxID=3824 RepID=A0AAN9QNZ2_CANGL